jgi:hypothetical protein
MVLLNRTGVAGIGRGDAVASADSDSVAVWRVSDTGGVAVRSLAESEAVVDTVPDGLPLGVSVGPLRVGVGPVRVGDGRVRVWLGPVADRVGPERVRVPVALGVALLSESVGSLSERDGVGVARDPVSDAEAESVPTDRVMDHVPNDQVHVVDTDRVGVAVAVRVLSVLTVVDTVARETVRDPDAVDDVDAEPVSFEKLLVPVAEFVCVTVRDVVAVFVRVRKIGVAVRRRASITRRELCSPTV